MTVSTTVTELLGRLRMGDRQALRDLFPLVYDEPAQNCGDATAPAGRFADAEHDGTGTRVVLKLAASQGSSFQDRAHFMAVAAVAMRQILIDEARRRSTARRGGGRTAISISDIRHALEVDRGFSEGRASALLALDAALSRLQRVSDRQSRIVDCRFFGGMSIEETATALGISPATMKREWSLARAWLYRDMQEDAS